MDAIVLTPEPGRRDAADRAERESGGHAGETVQTKRSPESDDLSLQVSLVAGARNRLYRRLCWAAA